MDKINVDYVNKNFENVVNVENFHQDVVSDVSGNVNHKVFRFESTDEISLVSPKPVLRSSVDETVNASIPLRFLPRFDELEENTGSNVITGKDAHKNFSSTLSEIQLSDNVSRARANGITSAYVLKLVEEGRLAPDLFYVNNSREVEKAIENVVRDNVFMDLKAGKQLNQLVRDGWATPNSNELMIQIPYKSWKIIRAEKFAAMYATCFTVFSFLIFGFSGFRVNRVSVFWDFLISLCFTSMLFFNMFLNTYHVNKDTHDYVVEVNKNTSKYFEKISQSPNFFENLEQNYDGSERNIQRWVVLGDIANASVKVLQETINFADDLLGRLQAEKYYSFVQAMNKNILYEDFNAMKEDFCAKRNKAFALMDSVTSLESVCREAAHHEILDGLVLDSLYKKVQAKIDNVFDMEAEIINSGHDLNRFLPDDKENVENTNMKEIESKAIEYGLLQLVEEEKENI